jgi:hypothetical protein
MTAYYHQPMHTYHVSYVLNYARASLSNKIDLISLSIASKLSNYSVFNLLTLGSARSRIPILMIFVI